MPQREFLIFRLYAPISSFGEITVGQRRSIWREPSKSAVFGFLAACLGIERKENDKIQALEQKVGFAVRIDNYGTPLRDFHTAMAPTEASRKRWEKNGKKLLTRKDDLECDDLSTMLSERLYSVDGNYVIALWLKDNDDNLFETILKAIKSPKYTPYLGRKACPLGLPLKPEIIVANRLNEAFSKFDTVEIDIAIALNLPKINDESSKSIFFDIGYGLDADDAVANTIRTRRDKVRDRSLWHFANRKEGRIDFETSFLGVEE